MSHWKQHWSQRHARNRPVSVDAPDARTREKTMPEDTTNGFEPEGSRQVHPKPKRRFLTTPEAATLLRLSPRTLERFRVEGTGPRFTKAGPGKRARVLYREEDLEAWLQGFDYGSTSEY